MFSCFSFSTAWDPVNIKQYTGHDGEAVSFLFVFKVSSPSWNVLLSHRLINTTFKTPLKKFHNFAHKDFSQGQWNQKRTQQYINHQETRLHTYTTPTVCSTLQRNNHKDTTIFTVYAKLPQLNKHIKLRSRHIKSFWEIQVAHSHSAIHWKIIMLTFVYLAYLKW